MDSAGCFGFKQRITEIGDNQESLTPSPPLLQSSTPLYPQENKEEQGIAENKKLSFLSDSKKASCPHLEASRIITEENQELGFTSGARKSREASVSGNGGLRKMVEDFGQGVEKIEDFKGKQEKVGSVKCEDEVSVKESSSSVFIERKEEAFVINEVGAEMGSSVEEVNGESPKEMESRNLLEVKKKQLLEELEVVLMAEDKMHAGKVSDFEGSLKIEVIDQTALIKFNDHCAGRKENKDVIQEVDGKKSRRSRRKAKKDFELNGRPKNVLVKGQTEKGCRNNGDGTKKLYSRKEMEALRFANIVEQRNIWKEIYNMLGAAVSREYDDLAGSKNQKHIHLNLDPRPRFAKKEEAPAILREACAENVDCGLISMENNETESLFPVDPVCCPNVGDGDGYTGLEEENSEDDDSDEDFASIQKPAFSVEGEPNFESGPPEDGLEYLRRVRWEAAQIPKVKVAKFDGSKFNKEQSVYMPQIPDIAQCPEYLLPLKQWEDSFLADFSELRLALSRLEGSSEKMQSLRVINEQCHSHQLLWDNIQKNLDTDTVHSNQSHDSSRPQCTVDEPSIFTAEDVENSQPSGYMNPKTLAENSSPSLSVILRMDSVTRVSTLRKCISSVENMNTLSRNDCLWLFALCAVVDTPLDADTCAALRSMLRKCATLRAVKTELDDEVVMLNILATVAGRYFGQSGR
ncbi:hypothetical protein I3843_01G093600 [Carya illinoinensis]|nr:hypothetical protein I3760_01G095700 [Carya illinoinensis]KAG7995151.1 hypothetical protein I3843_01G093600 [Carya illinoinensis]